MNKAMSDSVTRLFMSGRLSVEGLMKAVTKGWITQDKADELIAAKSANNDA